MPLISGFSGSNHLYSRFYSTAETTGNRSLISGTKTMFAMAIDVLNGTFDQRVLRFPRRRESRER